MGVRDEAVLFKIFFNVFFGAVCERDSFIVDQ